MIELTLVVPGLLGPWPECRQPGFPLPHAPALESILAAAQRRPRAGGLYGLVAGLHGVASDTSGEPPIAAISRCADGGRPDQKWWVRLDLVHLELGQMHARVGEPRALDITATESEGLWQVLEPYFRDLGWTVEPLHPARWYLCIDSDSRIPGISLGRAPANREELRLTADRAAGRWHVHLTEIQMLLHETAVNRDRERRGKPPINALWAWGGGALPAQVQPAADTVYSADAAVAGLAALSGGRWVERLPQDLESLLGARAGGATVLVTFEEPGDAHAAADPSRWRLAVETLEQRWSRPSVAALRTGKLRRLRLCPCNGSIYQMSFVRAWFGTVKRGPLCRHL